MVQRIGGMRRKTRYKLKKDTRSKSKVSLSRYFQTFKDGDKVLLNAEPAVQKGMYFPRFHGNTGTVQGKQGECYMVNIKDKKKAKQIIVHPVHLRKVE